LLDILVAIHDEHRQRFLVRKRTRGLESLHRLLAAQSRQLGVRVAYVPGDRVVESAEVVQVVEKLFHPYSPFPLRRLAAIVARRCNTGCGMTFVANTMAFCAVVNGHAPSRIEPCLGMPSTMRDMWCMPDAGRILLDSNSIDASGPPPRRRNEPVSANALTTPSAKSSGRRASFIAALPLLFMVLCS